MSTVFVLKYRYACEKESFPNPNSPLKRLEDIAEVDIFQERSLPKVIGVNTVKSSPSRDFLAELLCNSTEKSTNNTPIIPMVMDIYLFSFSSLKNSNVLSRRIVRAKSIIKEIGVPIEAITMAIPLSIISNTIIHIFEYFFSFKLIANRYIPIRIATTDSTNNVECEYVKGKPGANIELYQLIEPKISTLSTDRKLRNVVRVRPTRSISRDFNMLSLL